MARTDWQVYTFDIALLLVVMRSSRRTGWRWTDFEAPFVAMQCKLFAVCVNVN